MRDANLGHGTPGRLELDQQLGGEEGALRLDRDPFERLPAEELAGAVDVGHPQAEEDAVGQPVRAGVHGPHERIGALDPETSHDVGCVRRGQAGRQPADVDDPELAVAVGEGDELVAGGPEPRQQGGPIASVDRVMHDAHDVRVPGRERVGEVRRPVAGAVVDGDDLERIGQARQCGEGLIDQRFEVGLLVMGREEIGETRDPVGQREARVHDGRAGRLGHVPGSRRPTTRLTLTPRLPRFASITSVSSPNGFSEVGAVVDDGAVGPPAEDLLCVP